LLRAAGAAGLLAAGISVACSSRKPPAGTRTPRTRPGRSPSPRPELPAGGRSAACADRRYPAL